MKVWITKHALTLGIYEKEAEACGKGEADLIRVSPEETGYFTEYFHKPDWHPNRDLAVDRAQEMLLKKLQSLKKQVARLEKMSFYPDAKAPN